jgi:hypothetical protein
MAQESIKWMNSLPDDKPVFRNYWQFSVHAPFNAKEELINKYREVIVIKKLQNRRYELEKEIQNEI